MDFEQTTKDTMNLSELPPAKLTLAIKRADERDSALCSEMIAAGRGCETPIETRTKTDELSLRWIAARDQSYALRQERDRRMAWHGSLRRITAAA